MSHAVKIYKIFEGVLSPERAEEFVTELEGIQESTLIQTLKTLVTKEDLVREIGITKEDLGKEIVKVKEDLAREIGKLDVKITEEIGKLDVKIADVRADIIKWMFLFWIGQVASILAILKIARVF